LRHDIVSAIAGAAWPFAQIATGVARDDHNPNDPMDGFLFVAIVQRRFAIARC
jgi:hypothetical protein